MWRQRHLEDRRGAWRALALAAGGAAGVVMLLVLSVGLIWLVGRSSSGAPAIGAQPPPTPTPRSLSLGREGETNAASIAQLPTPSTGTQAQQPERASSPLPTSPPDLLAVSEGAESSAPGGVVFSAPGSNPFGSIASGSWQATTDTLQNDGTTADAEPWLPLATVPGAAFAVEAEIRVNGLIETFCDQSFGFVGGDVGAGRIYGAGILFPCGDGAARARVTDALVWEDGYHADPALAESAFDPGDGWRTYRFELRGDTVRLIVDGVGIVTGTLDRALAATGAAEAGIWSQGVDLEIRAIEIFPLPAS